VLECLILGDSLAVGLGASINRIYQPGCAVIGTVGATTSDIARATIIARNYRTVVISAGSNDHADADWRVPSKLSEGW